ncbi:MAG TPA: 2-oxo acid dehydrogenase subunit E2, partial [Tichowtungia sp.]|nr:2-oxo acid dehydrogenase subunit E2 [Tichowtungia sp.]
MEFKLPELGENIESGDIINVLVSEGDSVSEGQSVLEIEAGKASMEIPAPVSGTVTNVHVAQGDTVEVDQLVMEFEEGGEQKSEDGDQKSEDGEQKTEDGGQKSETESADEPAVEEKVVGQASPKESLRADEKTEEHTLPDTGSVSYNEEKPAPASGEASEPVPPKKKSDVSKALAVSASPKVRRLARELGVDIHLVPPSGPAGFITAEDVKEFARDGLSGSAAPAAEQTTRVEKMTAIRKATMNHMSHCWATIPHVTQHDTADITELEALRKRYAPKAEAVGTKLTMTAILIKIISSALKVHPKFNCSIDPEKGEIIYKEFCNIGIAMDTPKGLLVPVIQDGDRKNMVELAVELKELAEKARAGKVETADMKNGTFTFTNLGIIGGSFFT